MGDSPIPEDVPPRTRRIRLLRLSGRATAAWLVVCFALTAVLIPMALRLQVWVEFELVVGVWWAIWLIVLTCMLHAGHRVSDDHQLGQPRNWFSSAASTPTARSDADRAWWDGFFWGSCVCDGEAAAIVIGLFLLVVLIWFLFEIAIPLLLFLLYFVTRGMLARVINDRHRCRGRLVRSLAWAALWATAYTTPLAAAVWFIHFVHQQTQRGA
jgi:hypothetical protein